MMHNKVSDFVRWKKTGEHGRSHADVLDFFRAICEDEMEVPEELEHVVLYLVQKQMDEKLAEQGYHHEKSTEGDAAHARHRKFKEVVEELRDLPSQSVDGRIMDRFANLNDAELRVLKVLSHERSKAKMAECAGMPLQKFMEVKHGLEHKLK